MELRAGADAQARAPRPWSRAAKPRGAYDRWSENRPVERGGSSHRAGSSARPILQSVPLRPRGATSCARNYRRGGPASRASARGLLPGPTPLQPLFRDWASSRALPTGGACCQHEAISLQVTSRSQRTQEGSSARWSIFMGGRTGGPYVSDHTLERARVCSSFPDCRARARVTRNDDDATIVQAWRGGEAATTFPRRRTPEFRSAFPSLPPRAASHRAERARSGPAGSAVRPRAPARPRESPPRDRTRQRAARRNGTRRARRWSLDREAPPARR